MLQRTKCLVACPMGSLRPAQSTVFGSKGSGAEPEEPAVPWVGEGAPVKSFLKCASQDWFIRILLVFPAVAKDRRACRPRHGGSGGSPPPPARPCAGETGRRSKCWRGVRPG